MTIIFNTFEIGDEPKRSYLQGFADAFNLRGSTRRRFHLANSPEDADMAAVLADWEAVGTDLSSAASKVMHE